jgi:hypothetical protein
MDDGSMLGRSEGRFDGSILGRPEGRYDGALLGVLEGWELGRLESDGISDGTSLG